MADPALNWATAEVKGGKLTVDLEGKIASGWKDSFETTVRLLPGGDWGKVQLKKHTVRVSHVTPGSEEKLRHHLESLVDQANAAVRPPEPEPEPEAHEDKEDDPPDARMTESFRAFAQDTES
ncbi:MAG TPA: hypothetical protein VG295_05860 [Solirubrobacteraceae bacterium]|nr:hypothetical protein [Solirubrobacteraceae bacterium]